MHDQLKTFLAHLRSTATTVVAAVATMTLASCSSAPPQETVDEFLQSPNIRALSTQEVKTLLVDAVLETTWIPVKRWRHGAYEVVDLNRPVGAPFSRGTWNFDALSRYCLWLPGEGGGSAGYCWYLYQRGDEYYRISRGGSGRRHLERIKISRL
jgi:hypothetical protein